MPEYGLGRLAAPDDRDCGYLLAALAPPVKLATRRLYRRGPILNQGQTSSCVGHAWRAWLSGAPLMTRAGPDAYAIYDACLPADEWSENDHDTSRRMGTSVRAGAKVLTDQTRCASYGWAYNVDDLRRWVLGGNGGVVLGINWHQSFFTPDDEGIIQMDGNIEGGHAIYCFGADDQEGVVYLQNSWGTDWGGWRNGLTGQRSFAGCCRLPYEDLDRLLHAQGEACTAMEQIPPEFRKVTS